jgi:DnaJ-class molecular chaperone
MKRPMPKEDVTEVICPACNGTGFPTVMQPVQPGRKIYPAPCKQCSGKGRIASAGAAAR